jgi:hypothetical protein
MANFGRSARFNRGESMSDIKFVTLKSEKTYLCQIVDDENLPGAIVMKQPVQVVMMPPRSQTDSAGMAFLPFLEFSEEFKTGIPFSPNDVLTITTPVTGIINQYNKMFGSGIQVVSNFQ